MEYLKKKRLNKNCVLKKLEKIEKFFRVELCSEGQELVNEVKEKLLQPSKKIKKLEIGKIKNPDLSLTQKTLTIPTRRLNSLQSISSKIKKKYKYLEKFKEKTLTFQLSESTDMAKVCYLLTFLSRIEEPESVDQIYGKLATSTLQKYCDLGFQKDSLSKKCEESCFFHLQIFKFFNHRCNENSGLKLKTFYLLGDLIMDALEKNFKNYLEISFSLVFDFEVYDGLINIVTQILDLSFKLGYKKFGKELKEKIDEFVEEFCSENEIEIFDFDRLPKDFQRFYNYFKVLLENNYELR